ncbi:MAG: hypothetical protein C0475_05635 [Planctomyces sp.]|nr:hypothetical protein [Planctomyces sp.]
MSHWRSNQSHLALRRLTLACVLLAIAAFIVVQGRYELLLVMAAVLGASWAAAGSSPPPRMVMNWLVLGAGLFVLSRIVNNLQDMIVELTQFLVIVAMIKLFDRRRVHDESQLLTLSVFIVIGVVLMSSTLGLGAILVAYTPLAIWAVVQMQITACQERQADIDAAVEGTALGAAGMSRRARRDLRLTAAVGIVASLGLALGAFVAVPRSLLAAGQSRGIFGRTTQPVTGFTENLELGGGGLISQDTAPIGEVTLLDDRGRATSALQTVLYLRGAVMPTYEYQSAVSRATWRPDQLVKPVRHTPVPTEEVSLQGRGDSPGSLATRYRVLLHSAEQGRQVLFTLWRPVWISLERADVLEFAHETGIATVARGRGRVSYAAASTIDYRAGASGAQPSPATEPGQGAEPDRVERANLLEAGPGSIPKEVKAYALRVLRESGEDAARALTDDGADLNYDTLTRDDVRRIVGIFSAHLRGRFEYTLDIEAPPEQSDPIDYFLNVSQQGHCEYFASAFTAMCQSLRIPSRVVTGYAVGEFNALAGSYVIRQSDAHAWSEVEINRGVWETFDPTPQSDVPYARRGSGGLWAMLTQLHQALEFTWIRNVVSYDSDWSSPGGTAAGKALRSLSDRVKGLTDRAGELAAYLPREGFARALSIGALLVGVGSVLIVMVQGGLHAWRRVRALLAPGARGAGATPERPEAAFYRAMLAQLRRAGLGKPAHIPPGEHARALAQRWPEVAGLVGELTGRYYAIAFAGAAPEEGHEAWTRQRLEHLRRTLDHARRAARAGAGGAPMTTGA